MKIINIEQFGDVYVVDQLAQIVDNQRNFFAVSKRKMTVTISDNLIETVNVEFKPSLEEQTHMDLAVPIPEHFKP